MYKKLGFVLVVLFGSLTVDGVAAAGSSSDYLPFLFPMVGGILGFLVFYYVGFRDIKLKELGMGILLVFLIMYMQPFFQNVIFFVVDVGSNADIVSKGVFFVLMISLWFGFVAGFLQQLLRYPLARVRSVEKAVFIGIGFGLGEAVLIPLIGLLFGEAPTTIFSLNSSLLGLYERFLVFLFHGSSTALMAYSFQRGWGTKGLIVLIVSHGLMDTLASFYQITGSKIVLAVELLFVTYVSIVIFVFTMRRVRDDFPI